MKSERRRDLVKALGCRDDRLLSHVLSQSQNKSIDFKCTVEYRNGLHGVPLHVAIRHGWEFGITQLLNAGANIQKPLKDRDGNTVYRDASQYAEHCGHGSIVDLLLSHHTDAIDLDERPSVVTETAECVICCDAFPINQMVTCTKEDAHHPHCQDCIVHLCEVTDIKKNGIACSNSTSECQKPFDPKQLKSLLEGKHQAKYEALIRYEAVRSLPADMQKEIKACPTCNTPVSVPSEVGCLFDCPSSTCNFLGCIDCGGNAHFELSCEAAQWNGVNKLEQYKRAIENAMSEAAHTQACPGCATKVSKIDACNHMECACCSTHFCNICGEDIAEDRMNHFSEDRLGRGEFDTSNRRIACGLYEESEWEKDAPERIADAKKEAINNILNQDPSADIQALRRVGGGESENIEPLIRDVPRRISREDYEYELNLINERQATQVRQARETYYRTYFDYFHLSHDRDYAIRVASDECVNARNDSIAEAQEATTRLRRDYERQLAYYRGERTFEGQPFPSFRR